MSLPAIYSQCNASAGQLLSAIKQIGFDDVIEVALGAEITASKEAEELQERMEKGGTPRTRRPRTRPSCRRRSLPQPLYK